jgi:predicted nucleic acid-binding protein
VSFLLDTNVVSEWTRPRPHPGVIAWLTDVDEDRIFLSVVTFAELRHGVNRLPDGARRRRLDVWLRDELSARFDGRVLSIDAKVADAWGVLVAQRDALGRPIGVVDAFIAATAACHGLTLVTRNGTDFRGSVASILDPWQSATGQS